MTFRAEQRLISDIGTGPVPSLGLCFPPPRPLRGAADTVDTCLHLLGPFHQTLAPPELPMCAPASQVSLLHPGLASLVEPLGDPPPAHPKGPS